MASRSVSRILCPSRGDGHLSGATVTDDLDAAHLQTSSGQLVCTGTQGRPLGLAPDGVYLAARVTTNAGGLLHHPFTLTGRNRRSTFCCTFPRVTPGGRYPPSCPVESGLSSTVPEGSAATARPTRLTQCGTSPRQRRQRLLRPLPIARTQPANARPSQASCTGRSTSTALRYERQAQSSFPPSRTPTPDPPNR